MSEPQAIPSRRSLYFEEFSVGQTVTSPGRTITETDVVAFAALSGDYNVIHTDAVYAAQGPFGRRVAHGLLGLSIAVGLISRLGFMEETTLAFRELGQWKFSLPIYLNDTIHVRAEILETRPVRRLNAGRVTLWVEILNQDGKVVQQGNWEVLVKSKEEA